MSGMLEGQRLKRYEKLLSHFHARGLSANALHLFESMKWAHNSFLLNSSNHISGGCNAIQILTKLINILLDNGRIPGIKKLFCWHLCFVLFCICVA